MGHKQMHDKITSVKTLVEIEMSSWNNLLSGWILERKTYGQKTL
jgi:hypothetical protein